MKKIIIAAILILSFAVMATADDIMVHHNGLGTTEYRNITLGETTYVTDHHDYLSRPNHVTSQTITTYDDGIPNYDTIYYDIPPASHRPNSIHNANTDAYEFGRLIGNSLWD